MTSSAPPKTDYERIAPGYDRRYEQQRYEGTESALRAFVCVNAIHHFADVARFSVEARSVLRPGGRVLAIALDPGAGHPPRPRGRPGARRRPAAALRPAALRHRRQRLIANGRYASRPFVR